MIANSECKINLGLNVTNRRADGYHDIETVMYPIKRLRDIIEIQKQDQHSTFSSSGLLVDCSFDKNLCVRAMKLMQTEFGIGHTRIHLHKMIPMGAGLGGGSANATTVLTMCDSLWSLNLTNSELKILAAKLGSDTAFFVDSVPQLATSRGEILTPLSVSLGGLWILLIKPDASIGTAEAYGSIRPGRAEPGISEAITHPISDWKNILKNDFESVVFTKLPILAEIKSKLYERGAIYASMSGSGSTVYGIFESRPTVFTRDIFTHIEQL